MSSILSFDVCPAGSKKYSRYGGIQSRLECYEVGYLPYSALFSSEKSISRPIALLGAPNPPKDRKYQEPVKCEGEGRLVITLAAPSLAG